MENSEHILDSIASEFPHQRRKITELFYESSNFTEICEDYVLCLEYINKLELIKDSTKEKVIYDLKLVLAELKVELLTRLSKM